MEARTNAKLRLAELAATLPERLLSRSLLTDYGEREAAKQAQALTSALLRQLGTWPRATDTSNESVPKNWESELAVGGDAEKVCRRQITTAILAEWGQPPALPDSTAGLARYGQAAYDLAKAAALSVVLAAYPLAQAKTDVAALAELTREIFLAWEAPAPPDLGELVQVSADTRSLLARDWKTAQKKLTGMQFHHFGAFYKRSWRANDWMWGRLDGAGWLVHVLLDPRRVRWIVQARAGEREEGSRGPQSRPDAFPP